MSFDPVSYAMGKATGGGGSSVEVESLSVTENGTYTAPSGKAYSPVTVAVSSGVAFTRATSIVSPSIFTVTVTAKEVTA